MLFYKQLDLPKIPKKFLSFDPLDQTMTSHAVDDIKFDYGKDHLCENQIITPPHYLVRMVKYEELNAWLSQYLPKIPNIVFSQVIPADSGKMIVHTDIKRIATLNYMIDLGGDNVTTNWYQERGQDIIRKEKTPGYQTDTGYVEYSNLDLLDSTVLQKNCWYLLRTNVLHDVTQITSTRKYLGISYFDQYDLDYFKF
jgi:hypothetical protein